MASGRYLRVVLVCALFTAMGAGSREANGQGLEGTVGHRATGDPLPGVLISVMSIGGERVRGVLTDSSGGFKIEVPMGRYQVRTERIGLRAETTHAFDLNTMDMRLERIEMAERAVEIAGLVVDSRVQSCRLDPEAATQIQRWWSEARTALGVSAALQREQFGPLLVERFEREWDRDARELIASSRRVKVSTSSRPFVASAADQLAEEGFVRGVGAEQQYYAPDAEVLLSTIFLSQHCFSLVDERESDDQLGLRFEPVEGREVTDIAGTLWVDTTTAELRDLDFRYVNVAGPESSEAGGKIVFDYLPSGAWIVSDWYIRMPKLGMRRGSAQLKRVGYLDAGGSATPLSPPEPGGAVGTLRGVVVDSLRGGGLANAVVTILGTSRRTLTDEDGSFLFFEVPAGIHYLSFAHHEIVTWGLHSGYTRVDVRQGAVAEAELAVPSFEQTALKLCLGEGVDAETVVVGHVLGPTREAQAHLPIQLVFERRVRRSRANVSTLNLRTDEYGRFVACSVPADEMVTLRAGLGDRWSEVADFIPRDGELTYREIRFSR